MRCPRCPETELSGERTLGGVEVDVCPSCSGSWLDAGELEALIGRTDDALDGLESAPTSVACPRCDLTWLAAIDVPGLPPITVDRCPDCHGVWLDARELGALHKRLGAEQTLRPLPLSLPEEREDDLAGWRLAGLWVLSLVLVIVPFLFFVDQFGAALFWPYMLGFAAYVTLGGLLEPQFDRGAFQRSIFGGFSRRRGADAFERGVGYVALFLLPGRIIAVTLVLTWRRFGGR